MLSLSARLRDTYPSKINRTDETFNRKFCHVYIIQYCDDDDDQSYNIRPGQKFNYFMEYLHNYFYTLIEKLRKLILHTRMEYIDCVVIVQLLIPQFIIFLDENYTIVITCPNCKNFERHKYPKQILVLLHVNSSINLVNIL